MAKYLVSTNLDKLPADLIAALVEAGCTIEKYQEHVTTEYQESSIRSQSNDYANLLVAMKDLYKAIKSHNHYFLDDYNNLDIAVNEKNYEDARKYLSLVTKTFAHPDEQDAIKMIARYLGNLS